MRRTSALAWLVWLCLFAISLFAHAADVVPSSAGTLSWQSIRLQPTIPLNVARQAAERYLGQPANSDQAAFVQITDSARYGNVTKTVFYGWRLHYPDIAFKNAKTGATAKAGLTLLINGADPVPGGWPAKALVAAFTDPNLATWQPPVLPQRDYVQEMQYDGWNVTRPQGAAPRSTVTQVLGAFWTGNGIDPSQAGQIMLQPMLASPQLPAIRSGNSLKPILPPALYWTVLVSGSKTHVVSGPPPVKPTPKRAGSEEKYMSGLIALHSDLDGRSLRGVYLP